MIENEIKSEKKLSFESKQSLFKIFKNNSQNFLENSEFIYMMSENLQNDKEC